MRNKTRLKCNITSVRDTTAMRMFLTENENLKCITKLCGKDGRGRERIPLKRGVHITHISNTLVWRKRRGREREREKVSLRNT